MKVVQVILNFECGGLEHLVIQLAQALKAKSLETKIISLESKGELFKEAYK